MNGIKKVVIGLLLVIPAAYSCGVSAGSVVIAKENGDMCTLPLPVLPETSVRYNLRRTSSPCDHFNDNVRTIIFREVPSATTVTLSDYEGSSENGGECTKSTGDFLVTLKTTRKQTTTPEIHLDHLNAYSDGQMVEPGVQLVSRDSNSHLRDKLSCVKIEISDVPPKSPAP